MAKERTLDARGLTPEEAQAALDDVKRRKKQSTAELQQELKDAEEEIRRVILQFDDELIKEILQIVKKHRPELLKEI